MDSLQDQDIVNEFLVESYENLDQLDRDLVILEQDPRRNRPWAASFARFTRSRARAAFSALANWNALLTYGREPAQQAPRRRAAPSGRHHDRPARARRCHSRNPRQHRIIGAEGEADYTALIQTLVQLQSGVEIPAPLECVPQIEAPQKHRTNNDRIRASDPHQSTRPIKRPIPSAATSVRPSTRDPAKPRLAATAASPTARSASTSACSTS